MLDLNALDFRKGDGFVTVVAQDASTGAVLMVANVWLTIAGRQRAEAPLREAPYDPEADRPISAVPAE